MVKEQSYNNNNGVKMIKNKLSLMALALAALSTQAFAGTATATFQATATLNSACTVSASTVSFGAITPAATGTAAATGTVTSTCSNNVPYTLAINGGVSADISARTMAGAASGNTDKLAYNLYTESAATNIWGDGVKGKTVGLTGTGIAQTSTVYGQLSLNQYLKPDTYTDNLTVTLAY